MLTQHGVQVTGQSMPRVSSDIALVGSVVDQLLDARRDACRYGCHSGDLCSDEFRDIAEVEPKASLLPKDHGVNPASRSQWFGDEILRQSLAGIVVDSPNALSTTTDVPSTE